MDAIHPGEHVLDEELGFAIGVGWEQASIFLNRDNFWLSIDGCRGGKYETAGSVSEHGFKQGKGGGCVVSKKYFGVEHGLASFNEGGKMEDSVEGLACVARQNEKVFKGGPVSEFSLDEIDAWREQVAPAVAKIVKNESLMSFFYKQTRYGTTDVPCATSNQYLHKKYCPFVNSFDTLEVYYNR